jgi:hypothetical protein
VKMGRDVAGKIVASFKVPTVSGGNKIKHEKQSGLRVSEPKLEPGTYRIRSSRDDYLTAPLGPVVRCCCNF